MREQLIQYVNLLFAGNDDVEEIKQEILQNTLDRYDDLISQGRQPEEAYRYAVTGIGDVNEIINGEAAPADDPINQGSVYAPIPEFEGTASALSRMMKAVAIFLYIISPVPILLFERLGWDEVGICCTLVIVAIATLLLLLFKSPGSKEKQQESTDVIQNRPSRKGLKKSVSSLVSTVGLVLYFLISFATGAWFITWLIFPIIGAVKGVLNACIDLKEDR